MTERDDNRYILFIDDESLGLQGHEHEVRAMSVEDAMAKGQEEFSCGLVRSVITGAELDEADEVEVMRSRAMRSRDADHDVLTQALASVGVRFPDEVLP